MKSWNYTQITEEAERKIISLMADADKADSDLAGVKRQWAYGVYLGWCNLCMGWMEADDNERLEVLTGMRDLRAETSPDSRRNR